MLNKNKRQLLKLEFANGYNYELRLTKNTTHMMQSEFMQGSDEKVGDFCCSLG